MPKSSKKRKDKAADFAKAKLKLGKGKQAPSNVIDTSFKARSVALPSQSITRQKAQDAPTTKRKLTFEDLVVHLRHYNATTRRDALLGLRELFDAHWELLESSLTPLINATARLIPDDDATVRKTLLGFLAWLMPRIHTQDILPHSPTILLFSTSAQTHIFPEIRIDAIKFLNILLEHVPQIVVEGWSRTHNTHGARVLEGYLGLLNVGTKFDGTEGPVQATSTASVVLTPLSKLVVLQSLASFLSKALGSSHSGEAFHRLSIPTWYISSAFSDRRSYESFENLFETSSSYNTACRWTEELGVDGIGQSLPEAMLENLGCTRQWSIQNLSEAGVSVRAHEYGDDSQAEVAIVKRLVNTLSSTLLATFLDCVPAVFSPDQTPPEVELRTILAVAQVVRSLHGFLLRALAYSSEDGMVDPALANLHTMLGYLGRYFPYQGRGNRNVQVEQTFHELNIIFCELTALSYLTTGAHSKKSHALSGRSVSSTKAEGKDVQINSISDYITMLLRGESTTPNDLGKPVSAEAYSALLPAIWSLLTRPGQNSCNPLFEAVIDHSLRTSSKSHVKPLTIAFIARLVLLENDPFFNKLWQAGTSENLVNEWVMHLPQTLWEFGASNLAGSELILKSLMRIFQRKTQFSGNPKAIADLQLKLVPYFSINHPTRGRVPGPFRKLPESLPLRRLALDLAVTLTAARGTRGTSTGLKVAVQDCVSDSPEAAYWTHLTTHLRVS